MRDYLPTVVILFLIFIYPVFLWLSKNMILKLFDQRVKKNIEDYKYNLESKKKAHFEIVYSSVVKINEQIHEKKELEKIILSDVQTDIYPDLEKSFLNLLHNSGYPGIKFEKKIDFENLYNQKFN